MSSWPSDSVDLVLTDPPYFIDRMNDKWDKKSLDHSKSRAGTVGSLPVGMKFDREQGGKLHAFLLPVFAECHRVLKPGGFLVSFSQARLYHRMALAAEESGFEIRDMFGWTYEGQAKAFSQQHFIRKMKISASEKAKLLLLVGNRKTPQLKPMIEPMVFGQKPKNGTFVQNWARHGVGLIDSGVLWDGKFPGNLMGCPKPGKRERGEDNDHLTVKPQKILRHLIKILTAPGAIVADPFLGSGSTLVAALAEHRVGLGAEKDREHAVMARVRISEQEKTMRVSGSSVHVDF